MVNCQATGDSILGVGERLGRLPITDYLVVSWAPDEAPNLSPTLELTGVHEGFGSRLGLLNRCLIEELRLVLFSSQLRHPGMEVFQYFPTPASQASCLTSICL